MSQAVACPGCGTKNRVPVVAKGRPRCASCQRDLPWLVDVGEADFDALVGQSSVPVLVDLWAPWCGPCHAVAPVLEQLSVHRAGSLRIAKVNVDDAPAVSSRLGVQGIPTMVLFRDGGEVSRQVGAMPGPRIAAWLDQALGVA